jgi:hypothetical protein
MIAREAACKLHSSVRWRTGGEESLSRLWEEMGVRHMVGAFSRRSPPTSGRNGSSAFRVKYSLSPSSLTDDASSSLGLMLRRISLVRGAEVSRTFFDFGAMFASEILSGEGD